MRATNYVGACAECLSNDISITQSVMADGKTYVYAECRQCGSKWEDFYENDEF